MLDNLADVNASCTDDDFTPQRVSWQSEN